MAKREMRHSTLNKLHFIANAIIEAESKREEGKKYADLKSHNKRYNLQQFKRKLLHESLEANISIYDFFIDNGMRWDPKFAIWNVLKTPRQLNYLANELMYQIKQKHNEKPIVHDNHFVGMQMEFNFNA